jgi:hypothetical protein
MDVQGLAAGTFDDWHRPPGFPNPGAAAGRRAAQQLTNWWNSLFDKKDQEKCEADCDEDKRARDALCFVAKARGGKAAQKFCLTESDRIWNECLDECKRKFCPPQK